VPALFFIQKLSPSILAEHFGRVFSESLRMIESFDNGLFDRHELTAIVFVLYGLYHLKE